MFAYTKLMQAMVSAGAVSANDPYFNLISLLLNTTSTSGAQNNTFLDSSSNNFSITRNPATGPNAPTQGTFTPFSQTGWSNFFNGTTSVLNLGSNADFAVGSVFTIEGWIYPTSAPNNQYIAMGTTGITGPQIGYNGTTFAVADINVAWVLNASTNPTVNSWNHFALVRSGTGTNQCSLFLNGTRVANGTVSSAWTTTTGFSIGNTNTSTGGFPGYISNIRVVKGTDVYGVSNTTITVPTAPLSPVTNTVLLTCQSNRFVDTNTQVSAKTITAGGAVSVQAFSPFAPTAAYDSAVVGGSGYFDGTGDYITLPNNSIPLSNSDFTVEAWVYPLTNTKANLVGGQGDASTAAGSSFVFYVNTASTSDLYVGSTSYSVTSPTAPINQWSHVAYVRTGGTFSSYLNGTRVSTIATLGTSSVNAGSTTYPPSIGAYASNQFLLNGYISSCRLITGSGGYNATSSTITIPTAPLTNVTNTKFLTNFTNAGIYDAAAKNVLETVGNAQVSTTQAKFGTTSMAYDGTGDYLLIPDSPNLQLGTGDFTIEGFVYLDIAGVAYGLISKGAASTGWSVNITSGNKLQFSYTATQLTGATSLAATTWYYFAVVRSGSATGNLKLYLGTSGSTTLDATSAGAVTDNFNQTNSMYVGASRTGTTILDGYLDEIRITKGVARTVTTVPTDAFSIQ
jgi:hypothetical protein